MKKRLFISALVVILVSLSSPVIQAAGKDRINLRSSYAELPTSQVQQLPHKSIRKEKKWGFYGHSTISHIYEKGTIDGDVVVVDNSTDLTWHQSGSEKHMGWKNVEAWLKDLNEEGYAGCNDWRLPTVEEALTLLESTKNTDGLYINSVFNKRQDLIWTGDSFKSSAEDRWEIGVLSGIWEINFRKGSVGWMNTFLNFRFVRPVRSGITHMPDEEKVSSVIPQKEKPVPVVEDLKGPSVTALKQQRKTDSHEAKASSVQLRSTYTELPTSQVQQLPHKSIRKKKKWGFYGHSTISHAYEKETVDGDEVVVDYSTGLTWHQSGSEKQMGWKTVETWLKDLNKKGYAGSNDWRLPTVEEALTLLESTKNVDGLYINSIFDKRQDLIWTGDSFKSSDGDKWEISFRKGSVRWMNTFLNFRSVRPLHSGVTQLRKEKLGLIIEDIEDPPVATPKQKRTVDDIEAKVSGVELRSSYSDLSVSQVQSMPNILIRSKEKWGFYGHSTVDHKYEKILINGSSVVKDNATGLMWHQSGSDKYMGWAEARKWTERLNNKKYAGYNDWRLPTLEEAVSLIDPDEKSDGLHIDTAFDTNQSWIWTGDSCGSDGAWDVEFGNGSVHWSDISRDINYYVVRPVRTMERLRTLGSDESKEKSGKYSTSIKKDVTSERHSTHTHKEVALGYHSTHIKKEITLEKSSYRVYTREDSNVYHKEDCSMLYSTKNLIKYNSSQEAGKAGGLPCNYCNP